MALNIKPKCLVWEESTFWWHLYFWSLFLQSDSKGEVPSSMCAHLFRRGAAKWGSRRSACSQPSQLCSLLRFRAVFLNNGNGLVPWHSDAFCEGGKRKKKREKGLYASSFQKNDFVFLSSNCFLLPSLMFLPYFIVRPPPHVPGSSCSSTFTLEKGSIFWKTRISSSKRRLDIIHPSHPVVQHRKFACTI